MRVIEGAPFLGDHLLCSLHVLKSLEKMGKRRRANMKIPQKSTVTDDDGVMIILACLGCLTLSVDHHDMNGDILG